VIIQPTENEKKKLLKSGWLVIIILVLWTIFSPWGILKYFRLEKELDQVRLSNRQLQQDNQKLQKEIEMLASDPAYIEKIAREKHGLLRNNEVIYQFPPSKKKPGPP
jgi:cell division protein FtsB